MTSTTRNRAVQIVAAALAGGIAPAVWLCLKNESQAVTAQIMSGAFVWFARDLTVSLVVTVPAMSLACRFGLKRPSVLWAIASLIGAPIGYALANPLQYAWTPTEEAFTHGPYWVDMAIYMALFGVAGPIFGWLQTHELEPTSQTTMAQPHNEA